MTEGPLQVPGALERGLDGLRAVDDCRVEGEPECDVATGRWSFPIWFTVQRPSAYVSANTKWYVVVDAAYPYGRIALYPAVDGGIAHTFPHQERNSATKGELRWRTGKLCLESPFRGERGVALVRDPVGDATSRLRWHVERAARWIRLASEGNLQAGGDPFELPARPPTDGKALAGRRLVHDEGQEDYTVWKGLEGRLGVAALGAIPGISRALAVGTCYAGDGRVIRQWRGRPLTELSEPVSAFWWLWPGAIVESPWCAPATWGDLRRVGKEVGIDVDRTLRRLAGIFRGGTTDTLLLLGYAIPMLAGENPVEVHWDGILLPRLSEGTGSPPQGFRSNAFGWWQRDRAGAFGDGEPLAYVPTENWSAARLQARGRLPSSICDAKVAILGAGALGAAIAELLVRAGLRRLALYDDDLVAAGNVCRHPASLQDVGYGKVQVVSVRLQSISPLVVVEEHASRLPGKVDDLEAALDECDAVVDCTGSDDALAELARGWWPIPRVFASFSLGYKARRLFSYGIASHQFPMDEFVKEVAPWVRKEAAEWAGEGELLEGAGCWSPLFPARCDDVVLAAAVCVKELEAMLTAKSRAPGLRVYQSTRDDESGLGLALVSSPRAEPSDEEAGP